MRCGIIGCGRNTEDMHIPALKGLTGVEIAAVHDIDSERLKRFAEKFDIENYFENLNAFFDFCSSVDFIIISTPGFTHFELCKSALQRNFNVLMEKPATLNIEDTRTLMELASQQQVKVGVIQNYRYRDPVIKAKKAQDEGVIGKVTQFNSIFHGHSLFSEPTPWSWEERKNKSLLYEMMIHMLDLQVYFAGPVKRIIGFHSKMDKILKTTTNIYAIVEHESNAIGILDFQLFSSSNYIGFEIFGTANDVKVKFQPHYLRIYSGTVNPLDEIYYDYKRIWDFGFEALKDRLHKPKVNRRARSHFELFKRFVDCLEKKKPFPVDISEVIPTMEYAQMLSDLTY